MGTTGELGRWPTSAAGYRLVDQRNWGRGARLCLVVASHPGPGFEPACDLQLPE